jgi:large subunit ribosomal protein L6
MSRIAKYPIPVPKGVEVNFAGGNISVKGPLGTIGRPADPNVEVKKEGEQIVLKAVGNSRHANAMSGTMRALVANMVTGVTKGYERRLEITGVGYRAGVQGKNLHIALGYSHDVIYPIPAGITIATPKATEIVISGIDKQKVGQVAAEIRDFRPPEPYKGKGVRYTGEYIFRKEGKKK